jgi:uncharacterized protein YndB with AHSA1/START domain
MMKWILVIIIGIAALTALMAIAGSFIPKAHTATRSTVIGRSPDVLWQALTDCSAFPQWRSDVKAVEILPDHDGHKIWREDGKNGKITLETIESTPPTRLVLKIADPDLPFGGTWTYQIEPNATGSRITITEDGEIYNPIFRLMGRLFFSQTATIEGYLTSLGKKFGEDVQLATN